MKRSLALPILTAGALALAALAFAQPGSTNKHAPTVTGGTFIPTGTCTATCSASDFIAALFTPGASFTCNLGYAGCRFNFSYTAQRQQKQGLLYHHWVDRGLDGVHEIFIGDIASA